MKSHGWNLRREVIHFDVEKGEAVVQSQSESESFRKVLSGEENATFG
jgi:hypothetical protein